MYKSTEESVGDLCVELREASRVSTTIKHRETMAKAAICIRDLTMEIGRCNMELSKKRAAMRKIGCTARLHSGVSNGSS